MIDPNLVQSALTEMRKGEAQYCYFFERLKSPSWLEPLFDAGCFLDPPPLVPEGNSVRAPFWPESEYLVRMAALPETRDAIVRIVQALPDTDNFRVQEDIVEVVSLLPGTDAEQLVDRVCRWLETPYQLRLPEKTGKLIARLLDEDQLDAALRLSRTLFAVQGDHEYEKADNPVGLPVARARFAIHQYGELLSTTLSMLLTRNALLACEFVCRLLSDAIRLSRAGDTEEDDASDHSYVWRPRLERGRGAHDLRDILVSATVETLDRTVAEDSALVTDALRILESGRYHVFLRIAMHLLTKHAPCSHPAIARFIANSDVAGVYGLAQEYCRLARRCFGDLPQDSQESVLNWINDGPDLDTYKENSQLFWGEHPTDDEAERFKRTWQLEHLTCLEPHLKGEPLSLFETLGGELGKIDSPFTFHETKVEWHRPSSPRTTAELSALRPSELVAFLETWVPGSSLDDPTVDGLAQQVRAVVLTDPERWSQHASVFKSDALRPDYVYEVFRGFADATKSGAALDWVALLDLCAWGLSTARGGDRPADLPRWAWARGSVADLLSVGFAEGVGALPISLRGEAWEIVEALARDPDPGPEEAKRYESGFDPLSVGINSIRGKAIQASLRYALWVRRILGDEALSIQAPEVCRLLEDHLDDSIDASPAVRAIYGSWLPNLVGLDVEWTRRILPQLFPREPERRLLRRAVWETFLVYSQTHPSLVDVLKEQYQHAVEEGSLATAVADGGRSPEGALAADLMLYYWSERIDLSDPLLEAFFANASPDIRGQALEYVGRSLYGSEDQPPDTVVARLRRLWDARLSTATSSNDIEEGYGPELSRFGWWFVSGYFDAQWAIQQMLAVLALGIGVEPDSMVVKKLEVHADQFPHECVQCLRGIVDSDRQGWGILGWRSKAEEILRKALASGKPLAVEAAQQLVHYLGAKGHASFRSLLP